MSGRDLDFAAGQAGDLPPELPSVDDLQVAAAAAAAAMGEPSSTSSEESYGDSGSDDTSDDSSSEDDDDAMASSDEEESSSDDGAGAAVRAVVTERWAVGLAVDEAAGGVKVSLEPSFRLDSREGLAGMAEPDSDFVEESSEEESESDSDDDEDILEIHGYDDLRRVVDAMTAEGDGGDADDGGAGPSAAEVLFGAAPPPELDIEITPDEPLTPAGRILSVIEGTIVVRAAGGSRALAEGSVLVLEDRTMLGPVEDIFGPVQAPLYALRQAPGTPAPVPGAEVLSVDRLAQYVAEESLRVKGYDGDMAEEGVAGAEDPEQQFSDDEAEARYRRKLKSKRKDGGAGGEGGGSAAKQGRTGRQRSGGSGGRGRGRGGGGGRGPPLPQQQQQQQGGYPYPPYPPYPPQPYPGQYYPGPPQYLGQYYQQQAVGGPGGAPYQQQRFQAAATAGQFGAMSLQPHHVHPYGAPPPPRPPPPPGPPPPPPQQ